MSDGAQCALAALAAQSLHSSPRKRVTTITPARSSTTSESVRRCGLRRRGATGRSPSCGKPCHGSAPRTRFFRGCIALDHPHLGMLSESPSTSAREASDQPARSRDVHKLRLMQHCGFRNLRSLLLLHPWARPSRIPWAELLMRVFREDVLACPCGGRRVVLAYLTQPGPVKAILEHLGLASTGPPVSPAHSEGRRPHVVVHAPASSFRLASIGRAFAASGAPG